MAAENQTEAGFTIDGKVYAIPTLDSLTMDEAQVLFEYSGLTVEDFAGIEIDEELDVEQLDPEQLEQLKRMRNPGFLRALLHIAYARGNPALGRKRVERLVGDVNMLDAMIELAEQNAGDDGEPGADPTPESTSELDESSPRNSDGSSGSSGIPSNDDSAAPVDRPVLTSVGSSPRSASNPTPSGS